MPFKYWEDGVELVREDFNAIGAALTREIYDRVIYEMLQRTNNAFFQNSFLVQFSSATAISVTSGLGFYNDTTQTSPQPQRRPLYRASNTVLNITTPDGTNDRIDIVVASPALVDELSATRKYKDAIDDSVSDQTVVTQQDWEAELEIVAGTPAGSPSAPSTPAGKIKLAELYVTAVTGMSGSGAVTDSRTKMPVAGDSYLDTTGYVRLTAGASTAFSTLFSEIDNYIKYGDAEYIDMADLGVDPAAPAASKNRLYFKSGIAYFRENGGGITPLGSGGGGGGGLVWTAPDGYAPVLDEEFSLDVFKFVQDIDQKLVVYFKIPESYLAGRQLQAVLGAYSPSTANEFLMQVVSTLIRKNTDAITSTTNQETNDSGDITNSVANQYRRLAINITDSSGQINSVAVTAGDIIKLELTRENPSGTEDSADVRFVPSATEIRTL